MNSTESSLRIDKWLWAARFYKTRQLAIKALNSSQISINRATVKPSTLVRVGDIVQIKRGADIVQISVLDLSAKRGSAKIAQLLYSETAESIEMRQKRLAQLALQPRVDIDQGKPDKRKIRDSRLFKRGG